MKISADKMICRITALSVVLVMISGCMPAGVYAKTDESESRSGDDDFTVVMVGDILLHDGIEKCARREDGSYDFTEIFRHTKKEIESADLAMVNQEVIIGGEELRVTGYPSFNAPYEIADELAQTGFDVVCHATNHALDRGSTGIKNCLENWKKHPEVLTVGIYDDETKSKDICVYKKDGYSIAVLNYTYGTNGIPLPKGMPYAVDLLDEEKIKKDLADAKKKADLTIVCPHWGTEYELGISEMQKKWTKVFAENGADIIIGTHPHVIEPVLEYICSDGRKVPVFYSLGNFINWTSGSGKGIANRMVGAMAVVKLEKSGGGDVSVKEYGVRPLVAHVESETDGSTVYFLDDYTEAKSYLNEIRSRDPEFSYRYCEKLCRDVFGEEVID